MKIQHEILRLIQRPAVIPPSFAAGNQGAQKRRNESTQKTIAAIRELGGSATGAELAEQRGITHDAANRCLRTMWNAGMLTREQDGDKLIYQVKK